MSNSVNIEDENPITDNHLNEIKILDKNILIDNCLKKTREIQEYLKILKSSKDIKDLKKLMIELDIDYVDEDWTKFDWMIVFIAGITGIISDVLINQTGALKFIDDKVKELVKTKNVQTIKDFLDGLSKIFRNGASAPIDFQDFEIRGSRALHEIYSFGHDPLRFIEGIIQFITGNYRGVDKNGNIISCPFGGPTPNIAHAIIAYVAHMLSDFLNATSLPYPGSTLLMEFGSQEIRNAVTTAYSANLYNSRTYTYQNFTVLLISIIIHSYAVYDTWVRTKKINIKIGSSMKYQPMLLLANAMVMTENITVTAIRGIIFKQKHAFFKLDWPVIYNTLRHSIKYLRNEGKEIKKIENLTDSLLIKLKIEKKNTTFLSRMKEKILWRKQKSG